MKINHPKSVNVFLIACTLISLAFKVGIMSVTLHPDLFFIYKGPNLFISNGIFDIYQYLAQQDSILIGSLPTYYPPFTLLFFSLSHLFIQGVIAGFPQWLDLLLQSNSHLMDFPLRQNFLTLFLMKAPYLVFDLGILVVLLRFAETVYQKKIIILLWFFNPIVLYGNYMFGQFDIIPAFICISAYFLFTRKQYASALFLLGLGVMTKKIPGFIMPFFLLAPNVSFSKRLALFAVGVIPIVVLLAPYLASSSGVLNSLIGGATSRKLGFLDMENLGRTIKTMIFFVIYTGLLLRISSRQDSSKLLFNYCAVVFLLMYSLFSISIHYFIWGLPFFILAVIRIEKIQPWHLIALMVLLLVYKIKRNVNALGLFIPLDYEYFSTLPDPKEILKRYLPWRNILKTIRFAFVILSGYMAYHIGKPIFFHSKRDRLTS